MTKLPVQHPTATKLPHAAPRTPFTYLDEGVDFRFPSFGQSLDLHLADGAHVEVVHRRAASETGHREHRNVITIAGEQSQRRRVRIK